MADIVTEANRMLPHPPVGDGETVAAPSVGCFVRERLEVDHCDGGRLQSHSAFVGEFYHLISTFTSE